MYTLIETPIQYYATIVPNMVKKLVKNVLRHFGKRISNYYAPAMPFDDGMEFLKSFIDTPAWIIDIGAADGTPGLTETFPMDTYKHLLVDPAPNFSTYLKDCKEKYPETVFTENCFCGDGATKTIELNVNETGYRSSRYVETQKKITVPVKTLDEMAAAYEITGPVILKIDVEGAELDVLRGGPETLKKCDVVILETWINSHFTTGAVSFADLVAFMKESGFVVFDFFGGHTHKSGVLRQVDTVFVKEDSRYRTITK